MLQKLSNKMLERCPLQYSLVWKSSGSCEIHGQQSTIGSLWMLISVAASNDEEVEVPRLQRQLYFSLITRNFSPGWNFSLVALGNVNTPVKTSFYLHDKRFNPDSAYWAGIFSSPCNRALKAKTDSRDCGPNKLQVTNPNQPVVLCNFSHYTSSR